MHSLTDEYVLQAYVDGSDLFDIAPMLLVEFARFVKSERWPSRQALVVDQRQPPELAEQGFLPQWDLGLNLGLDHRPISPDWFAGVDSLVLLLQRLSAESGREFALSLCRRSEAWRQEHLAFVGTNPIDLIWLRSTIDRLIPFTSKP